MSDFFLDVYEMLRLGRFDDAVELLVACGFDDPMGGTLAVMEVVNEDRYRGSRGIDYSSSSPAS